MIRNKQHTPLPPPSASCNARMEYVLIDHGVVFCRQGWIECVGCADRACYDLSVHTKMSGEKLVAQVDLEEPVSFQFVNFSRFINPHFPGDLGKCAQRIVVNNQVVLDPVL